MDQVEAFFAVEEVVPGKEKVVLVVFCVVADVVLGARRPRGEQLHAQKVKGLPDLVQRLFQLEFFPQLSVLDLQQEPPPARPDKIPYRHQDVLPGFFRGRVVVDLEMFHDHFVVQDVPVHRHLPLAQEDVVFAGHQHDRCLLVDRKGFDPPAQRDPLGVRSQIDAPVAEGVQRDKMAGNPVGYQAVHAFLQGPFVDPHVRFAPFSFLEDLVGRIVVRDLAIVQFGYLEGSANLLEGPPKGVEPLRGSAVPDHHADPPPGRVLVFQGACHHVKEDLAKGIGFLRIKVGVVLEKENGTAREIPRRKQLDVTVFDVDRLRRVVVVRVLDDVFDVFVARRQVLEESDFLVDQLGTKEFHLGLAIFFDPVGGLGRLVRLGRQQQLLVVLGIDHGRQSPSPGQQRVCFVQQFGCLFGSHPGDVFLIGVLHHRAIGVVDVAVVAAIVVAAAGIV
mmetsp:Transcript_993/g.2122  ORF Transcript_993/g.2122 Transcript_993/m.2122 type:complete len:447 (+) Transcript_993:116-1456(+)